MAQVYTDGFIHVDGAAGEDTILLPITEYDNVLCAPKVVNNIADANGAPFLILQEGTIDLPDELFTK